MLKSVSDSRKQEHLYSIREWIQIKEYEIVAKITNACAGASRPQTFFEDAQLAAPADYVRQKHGRDFEKFRQEVLPDGMIVFTFDNGSVSYRYEFTEI